MSPPKYYTPTNRFPEVEREVATALAKVAYFVSPKIVSRIADLNCGCKADFKRDYGERIQCNQFFYEGSACVFPGVRRRTGKEETKLTPQKYHEAHNAILDANWFPRELWSFACAGRQYSGAMWEKSGLGEFELAHVLPHKAYEVAGVKSWFAKTPAGDPFHGLFTCAANVILVPKGMARPTDGTAGIRMAILNHYFMLYKETHAAGFGGFSLPARLSWCNELDWNDPVEPPDWEDRIKKLDEFRKKRIRALVCGAKEAARATAQN